MGKAINYLGGGGGRQIEGGGGSDGGRDPPDRIVEMRINYRSNNWHGVRPSTRYQSVWSIYLNSDIVDDMIIWT